MDRLLFQNSLSIYLPDEDNLLKEKHKQMFQFLDFSAQWQRWHHSCDVIDVKVISHI